MWYRNNHAAIFKNRLQLNHAYAKGFDSFCILFKDPSGAIPKGTIIAIIATRYFILTNISKDLFRVIK